MDWSGFSVKEPSSSHQQQLQQQTAHHYTLQEFEDLEQYAHLSSMSYHEEVNVVQLLSGDACLYVVDDIARTITLACKGSKTVFQWILNLLSPIRLAIFSGEKESIANIESKLNLEVAGRLLNGVFSELGMSGQPSSSEGTGATAAEKKPTTPSAATSKRSSSSSVDYNGYEFVLCGHSRGGLIAAVAALTLLKMGKSVRGLYTFGSPKLFQQYHVLDDLHDPSLQNKLKSIFVSVEHEKDPVPGSLDLIARQYDLGESVQAGRHLLLSTPVKPNKPDEGDSIAYQVFNRLINTHDINNSYIFGIQQLKNALYRSRRSGTESATTPTTAPYSSSAAHTDGGGEVDMGGDAGLDNSSSITQLGSTHGVPVTGQRDDVPVPLPSAETPIAAARLVQPTAPPLPPPTNCEISHHEQRAKPVHIPVATSISSTSSSFCSFSSTPRSKSTAVPADTQTESARTDSVCGELEQGKRTHGSASHLSSACSVSTSSRVNVRQQSEVISKAATNKGQDSEWDDRDRVREIERQRAAQREAAARDTAATVEVLTEGLSMGASFLLNRYQSYQQQQQQQRQQQQTLRKGSSSRSSSASSSSAKSGSSSSGLGFGFW